jgi:DNA-binding transcriptional ArsR family regulator
MGTDDDRHPPGEHEVLGSRTAHPGSDVPPAEQDLPVPRELAVLVALIDPTRRRLLDVLVEVGRANATGLAERLPVSRQAVVKHLNVLEAAGLVGAVRAGREVIYVPKPGALTASARWIADLSAAWVSRLEHAVESTADVGRRRNSI